MHAQMASGRSNQFVSYINRSERATQLPAKCAFTSTTFCEFHFCIMALSIFFMRQSDFMVVMQKMLEPICDLYQQGAVACACKMDL